MSEYRQVSRVKGDVKNASHISLNLDESLTESYILQTVSFGHLYDLSIVTL